MKVLDERTIEITGRYEEKEVTLKVSTIIAAYLLGTNKEIVDKITFGATEAQITNCSETRKVAEKYPLINLPEDKRELECHVLTTEKNNGNVVIHAEDDRLCGWNNDCITVEMPKEMYEKVFGNKNDIKITLTTKELIINDKY
ncbi:hypothetical protein COU61_02945 [Candidatus Pacearchaeota archaeon CG10_big_fil_rev_8_21_14_0_10_35_13]|nr:MAG: hypothetical protein COU61_02945 [Candidatus Pacearchaeota archaeon CG10_big_fil_rev_8_21_14_0_10_35_13]